MERNYPTKMFLFFVLTNFVFHFFHLFLPGVILCIVGIWAKSCLWIGLAILGLDAVLSVVEQLRIREAVMSPSDNPEVNELMDAFCGPGGLEAFGKVLNEKIQSQTAAGSQEEN